MSVHSGVPVFRRDDGSMSDEFLGFLASYNAARRKHGLIEAESWFDFSVPEMFRAETSFEAWQYWRWRVLRALVHPAEDYQHLRKIIDSFGEDRTFVVTSNCDRLHVAAGVPEENVLEIHGSLGYVQCSKPCSQTLYPVDNEFISRLRDSPKWVPLCPQCNSSCLRPNVMIFNDDRMVESRLDAQEMACQRFVKKYLECQGVKEWTVPAVVLEIGAGKVVSSIRCYGERYGRKGSGFIRINPSLEECQTMEIDTSSELQEKYFPIQSYASDALQAICTELNL